MRSFRAEAIFEAWLEMPKEERGRFVDFKRRCDAGEVRGFARSDFLGSETEEVGAD